MDALKWHAGPLSVRAIEKSRLAQGATALGSTGIRRLSNVVAPLPTSRYSRNAVVCVFAVITEAANLIHRQPDKPHGIGEDSAPWYARWQRRTELTILCGTVFPYNR